MTNRSEVELILRLRLMCYQRPAEVENFFAQQQNPKIHNSNTNAFKCTKFPWILSFTCTPSWWQNCLGDLIKILLK